MIRTARVLLLFVLLLVGSFSLMPNGSLIRFYLYLWEFIGLDPGRFGDNYIYISRAGHVIAYGLLTSLLISAVRSKPLVCTAGVVILAALLEAGQFLTVTRHPHLADFACSALGVLAGFCIWMIAERVAVHR